MSDTSHNKRTFMAVGLALTVLPLAVTACSKPAPKKTEVAAPPPPPPPPPPADTVTVSLQTTKGEIVLLLEQKKAPITVANFLHYVDTHKFDGATFWRSLKDGNTGFIQAGASGLTYPPIKHESTKETGLSHTDGVISMSRFAPNTATNEFTIMVGDNTYLDAGPKASDKEKLGYAAFGHVVKGMDVVKEIWKGRIDKHTREGGWAGQMLAEPVIITKAQRVG
ncbi:peptidylprolyl isomerase [Asticcacaulis sp. 201]|uniref:peptidylprolyl isomerase n=1 Tax=Asticcacaulis sp. 201 TaxID=3028787 RepID=UPI00291601A7|nr:peptidylprolyl isomerase [Asticcacaulis sp. 201]MDV6332694.1 peptidylprolyl isomerase [Asticcacaulis sp. 201]